MSILKTIQETFFSPKITILLIVIGGLLVKNNSFASDSTSTMLDEVTIEKEKHNEQNYSFDTKIETDTLLKESLQHSTLSEYIKGASPIFLRESGSGMTSTISMRGTQASHTNVYWNGFSINSQTMGQVDFNLIPIFFIDDAEIHPGGASAHYGNGAIGGSILLNSKSSLNQPFTINIQTSIASLKNLFSGINLKVGNKKIGSKTALFFQKNKNDFEFEFREKKETQKNAEICNWGILEEMDFKIGTKGTLSAKFWHTNYNREIQPMKQNNNNPLKYESIQDRSTRIIANYKLYTPTSLSIGIGWMNDYQKYKDEIISTNDYTLNLSSNRTWEWQKSGSLNCKWGGDLHYIQPQANSYKEGVIDWRGSIYLLTLWEIRSWIAASCNLRKDFVYHINVPFTPAGGLRFVPINLNEHKWILLSNIAKNAKIPTLNDRYWGDMDNRELLPENGFNVEVGSQYHYSGKIYRLDCSVMAYRNNVENWILWLPRGNIWKPINVDQVLAKGIEASVSQSITKEKQHHKLSINYSLNHTEVIKGFNEMRPFIGQQIPLLPTHNANFQLSGKIQHFNYLVQGAYVGERHTSDIFDIMTDYFLLSLQTSYEFCLTKKSAETNKYFHYLTLSLLCNNILNSDYETMPYKAMPGRNYTISLKWGINKNSKKIDKNENL